MADDVGAMRERLVIQQNTWPAVPLVSLTRSGSVATAVTIVAHGYASGEWVTVDDAAPAGYNGKVKITVLDALTFTYAVDSSLSTPATQAITVTYTSDAQGGRRAHWNTLATVFAEQMQAQGGERLSVGATQAVATYQFRVRLRPDFSPKQRAQWTPRWPAGALTKSLEINAVVPWDDPWAAGMRYQVLHCSEVQA